MLYIIIWFFTLLLSIFLFRKASGSLSLLKPNMLSIVFYYSLFITCFIGALLIVLNVDQHYMIARIRDDGVREIGYWLIILIMILLPATMVAVASILGFDAKKELNGYLKKPVIFEESKSQHVLFIVFSAVSLIGVSAVLYTFLMLNQIPLIGLLTGATSTELAQMRIDSSRNFGGNVLIRNILAINLVPLLSIIAYVYGTFTKDPKWRIWFVVLFFSSILINVYNLAKAPIFFYFLMLLLTALYIGHIRLSARRIFAMLSVGVIGIIIMYVFIQDVRDLNQFLSYNSGPIGRLILAQIAPFFLHLDLFGQFVPYLNGASLPSSMLSLYDVEHVRSARLTLEYYFPNRVEDGTGGVLNTIYAAEAYANFRYAGVILGTIYIGLLLQLMYMIFLRLPKHPIYIALFIFFTINIPRTLVGGFTDFLYNPLWIAVTVLTIGILIVKRVYQEGKDRIRLR
ncbi:O-antigen polymerase [Bacillus sp. FJAT-45037]|uniref:O-antigen polymerase n=1 Tax=Bacillus sp. FJAT-45037 TaxID=2011007 RepID=UPI000C24ACF3|nr:O-antigen polymerase [Bacillus sp. FJAT-45037]